MLRCLFEYHDHVRDYVNAYLVQTHGNWHFVGSIRPPGGTPETMHSTIGLCPSASR